MSQNMVKPAHIPVLMTETIEALAVHPGGRYIDCTGGGGGHAEAILEHSAPGGQLLGIDADPNALELARDRLSAYKGSMKMVNDNFNNLEAICIKYDFAPVHGILFDLGLSSLQLNGNNRGFSFQYDAPLDMRFNPKQEISAADIVNEYSENELSQLIRTYGEETNNRRIAHLIVHERPIKTTLELAHVIERAVGPQRGRIHPATKTFQAIRIYVNNELENLKTALKQAIALLGFEGRLVVISYHSLEDRIVKQFMQQESKSCICPPETPICVCEHIPSLRLVHLKATMPSSDEIKPNPRSRSARLRAAERIIENNGRYSETEHLQYINNADGGRWNKSALIRLRKIFQEQYIYQNLKIFEREGDNVKHKISFKYGILAN